MCDPINEAGEKIPDTTPEMPDVLYIGLQKAGSTYLRGFFEAHPNIVWTREAYRLQSLGLVEGYATAARAGFLEKYSRKANRLDISRPPIWIDMYESIGMGYRNQDAEQWSADRMMSAAPLEEIANLVFAPESLFVDIKQRMPRIRILLTIRNQLDWIFSNYHHFAAHLPKGGQKFDDFLATAEGRIVLSAAHYDCLVERLHQVFGAKSVDILLLEEVERDAQTALAHISDFLGCRYMPFSPTDADYNRGLGKDAVTVTHDDIKLRQSFFQKAIQRISGQANATQAERVVPSRHALKTEYGSILSSIFAASNVRLQQRLGTDLAAYGYPM